MKFLRIALPIVIITFFIGCGNSQKEQSKAKLTLPKGAEQLATFAGGCFWSIQEGFMELKGVSKAISGYSGGDTKNPTYEEVSAETTGHAEAVQVIYNPNVISFAQLVEAFLYMHDPTQLNRQGPDIGTSYRSVAFYRTADEKKQIENTIDKFNKSKLHTEAIVTKVSAFDVFYPAEEYHQEYYRKNPTDGYIQNVCGPKLIKLREAVPYLLKDEFKR